MKLKDEKGEHKVFGDWKTIKYGMFFQDISDKVINLTLDTEYISVDDINYYDYYGNLILFYIVNEFNKLIEYNDSKFIKVSIIYLIMDIINNLYDIFNEENMFTNFEIKRFNYLIKSETFLYDIEEKGYGLSGESEGFYGEYKDVDDPEDPDRLEKLEEDREELDAIDVDTEIDYEIDYLAGVNMG